MFANCLKRLAGCKSLLDHRNELPWQSQIASRASPVEERSSIVTVASRWSPDRLAGCHSPLPRLQIASSRDFKLVLWPIPLRNVSTMLSANQSHIRHQQHKLPLPHHTVDLKRKYHQTVGDGSSSQTQRAVTGQMEGLEREHVMATIPTSVKTLTHTRTEAVTYVTQRQHELRGERQIHLYRMGSSTQRPQTVSRRGKKRKVKTSST